MLLVNIPFETVVVNFVNTWLPPKKTAFTMVSTMLVVDMAPAFTVATTTLYLWPQADAPAEKAGKPSVQHMMIESQV